MALKISGTKLVIDNSGSGTPESLNSKNFKDETYLTQGVSPATIPAENPSMGNPPINLPASTGPAASAPALRTSGAAVTSPGLFNNSLTGGTSTRAARSGARESSAMRSGSPGSFSGFAMPTLARGSGEAPVTISDFYDRTTSVFSYEATIYDTEITGSGICSAYPVILGQFPIKNIFKGGSYTNMGTLYEIQNSLVDATVQKANQIVENYYASNPSAQTELATIRDQNNLKYETVLSLIKKISGYRRQTINSIYTANPDSTNLYEATSTSRTSMAEIIAAVNTSPDFLVDSDTGDYGNLSVVYVNDDIELYDTGNSTFDRLVEKLMNDIRIDGQLADIASVQTRTASQYQLMKAAFAQILEGRTFGEEGADDNPYNFDSNSLELNKVKSIAGVLSGETDTIDALYPFAKETLAECAKIINNNFVINTSNYSNQSEIMSFTLDRGIQYTGILYKKKSSGSVYTYMPSDYSSEEYELIYNSEDIDESSKFTRLLPFSKYDNVLSDSVFFHSPTVALNDNALTNSFMKQISVSLASSIMQAEASGSVVFDAAINPSTNSDVNISNTTSDRIRYVANLSNGQKIYLFDETLSESLEEEATPLSQIFLLSTGDLQDLQSQISQIDTSLSTSLSYYNRFLSNQCALTVLKSFYNYFQNIFNSFFLSLSSDNHYDVVRTIMLCSAAKDPVRAGTLYRMMHFNDVFRDWSACSKEADMKDYISDLFGVFTTDAASSSTDSDFENEQLSSVAAIRQAQVKVSVDTKSLYHSSKEVIENLSPGSGTLFEAFTDIANYIGSRYSSAAAGTEIYEQVRFAAYSMFIYFLKKMNIKYELVYIQDDGRFRGFVRYEKADVAFVIDSFNKSFLYTDAADAEFDRFKEEMGDDPTDSEKSTGNTNYFKYMRSLVKNSIQVYQDARSLFAHQRTVLQSISNSLASLTSVYTSLDSVYATDPTKSALVASRYATDESVVEAMYRSSRYQKVIPETGITSIATRSSNYRSIIEAAFKDLIPKDSNYNVAIVGIPYGLISRLREATDDRRDYFGVKLFSDDVRTVTDDQTEINYNFSYISGSDSIRPNLKGPYSVFIPGIYDDFDQTELVTSAKDNGIAILKVESDFSAISPFYRDEATDSFKVIDFPAALVQAAIESYLDDIYGLHVRYAASKGKMIDSGYPEESYADQALSLTGIDASTEEGALVYSRLKSMIMFHKDFVTTRMLDDLESSPAFDKIIYVMYNSEDVENVLTEFYSRIEV